MKNLLINTLAQGGFIILNKSLIKLLGGLDIACVLSFLIDKSGYFKGEDFYYTIENIQQDTSLTDKNVRACLKRLIEIGILIKREFKGIPPKQYYNIDFNALAELLNSYENDLSSGENGGDNPSDFGINYPSKNGNLNPTKNGRDNIINKNKDIKTKDINTKEKNYTKKENFNTSTLKEKSLFALQAKECDLPLRQNEALKAEFEQLWSVYPNKQGKQLAFNSYLNARKGVKNRNLPPSSYLTIKKGIENYLKANRGKEIKFLKHFSTFLNQCTFLDFQSEINLNARVGVIDNHEDYLNADKSIYIPKG